MSSGRSSRPSGRMSHSDAAEDAERRQELVRGGDLLTLAADVVGELADVPMAAGVADREA